MNWRRGLLLAAINLAVAAPMILIMETRDQEYSLTAKEIMAKSKMTEAPKPPEPTTPEGQNGNSEQAEQSVSFDPCAMWVEYPTPVVVLQRAEMPAALLAGWGDACPPSWTLTGRIRGRMTWQPTPYWMEMQRRIDAALCLLVAVLWFVIGAFPLGRIQKWWADPGSFITVFAVLAGAVAATPAVSNFAKLPATIAMLSWFWLFGLFVWKALKLGWKWRMVGRWPT